MKRIFLKVSIFLVFVFTLNSVTVLAASDNSSVPQVKVKTIKKDRAVKITVNYAEDVDRIEVEARPLKNYYKDFDKYQEGFRSFAKKSNTNGSKMTLTINTIPPGKYELKIHVSHKIQSKSFVDYENITLKDSEVGYKKTYDFSKVKVGQVIKFGSYEQDNNFVNGKEPIEWIVIKKTDKYILVLSKYILDAMPYNLIKEDTNWESCTLRKWLNGNFYKYSFNKQEKALIKKATLKNEKNEFCDAEDGNDTIDKVFCLSQKDMVNIDYFDSDYDTYDINRRASITLFTKEYHCLTYGSDYYTSEGAYSDDWWLRTPGDGAGYEGGWTEVDGKLMRVSWPTKAYDAVIVRDKGSVYYGGGSVDYPYGVRPAMYIRIK